MSVTVIHDSKPIARKDYECMASVLIRDAGTYEYMTFKEKRECVKARQYSWHIRKGEQYIRQFNTDGSDAWTFTAIPAMHDICVKYDLYPGL
jgi:hypothetical protein